MAALVKTTAAATVRVVSISWTLGSMTVTGSAVITDGYHDRIDMGLEQPAFHRLSYLHQYWQRQ
jgi:hypothetical protein